MERFTTCVLGIPVRYKGTHNLQTDSNDIPFCRHLMSCFLGNSFVKVGKFFTSRTVVVKFIPPLNWRDVFLNRSNSGGGLNLTITISCVFKSKVTLKIELVSFFEKAKVWLLLLLFCAILNTKNSAFLFQN